MNYPILMADIIQSRQQEGSGLMEAFKKLVLQLNRSHQHELLSPLTITLGDEFQGVAKDLSAALQIVFACEEGIIQLQLGIQMRFVLVHGQIDTAINAERAHEMLGPGLTQARQLLNALKKSPNRFALQLTDAQNQKETALNNGLFIYQSLIDAWKPKDWSAVSVFFQEPDYKKSAELLQVDKSSAWRRRKSLNIEAYIRCKDLLQYTLQNGS
ncbi:MAG: hypothetical protein C0424_09185 [Sphingobacteriaceae bacterium]|nr:hypothetical protein [Sphingobacteriaceae bacterium]